MGKVCALLTLLALLGSSTGQFNENTFNEDKAIIHLFYWPYSSIANECEDWLSKRGFGGVQVSPPNEHEIVTEVIPDEDPSKRISRPWWENYRPTSYELKNRMGTSDTFDDMVRRCNLAGIRVYVDVTLNHMSGDNSNSATTGQCSYNSDTLNYNCVPYQKTDFHTKCTVDLENGDKNNFQNCWLFGELADLDTSSSQVQEKLVAYMNKLLGYGVAGFRIGAAQHILSTELGDIYSSLENCSSTYFLPGTKPLIYQEVKTIDSFPVPLSDYTSMGRVTEFKYSYYISATFTNKDNRVLADLEDFGTNNTKWGMVESGKAIVFVDNHDNQKGTGPENTEILHFKDGDLYRMAVAFSLSWPYGIVKFMSSYNFTYSDQGPPQDGAYDIIPPNPEVGGCTDFGIALTRNWICEHRWLNLADMANFREVVNGTVVEKWWSDGGNQIAFSRGNRGFFAMNLSNETMTEQVETSMAHGTYCDVSTGVVIGSKCEAGGIRVTVSTVSDGDGGLINVVNVNLTETSWMAIHRRSLLPQGQ